jgi:hypothetical protein
VPSGGDWSLQRSAALFFEGTNRSVVERCVLHRLDGNGVMLSAFNQHANISHNTIVQTGGSAIALWGNSSGTHPHQPAGTGPDGTAGNFPRYNLVEGNFITQVGPHLPLPFCHIPAQAPHPKLLTVGRRCGSCRSAARDPRQAVLLLLPGQVRADDAAAEPLLRCAPGGFQPQRRECPPRTRALLPVCI